MACRELPVEIWTKICSYIQNFEHVLSAVFVCRDFYSILCNKLRRPRPCEIAVMSHNCSLTFQQTYLKQYFRGDYNGGSYQEDFRKIESKLYSVMDTELVLHQLVENYYQSHYPLTLKFDACLLFTHNIRDHVRAWGLEWGMLRDCLLRNAPIIIAISTDKETLLTEESFKEQVAIVHKYVNEVHSSHFGVTVIPFINGIAHEEFNSYVPWYDGPDLATALAKVQKVGFNTFSTARFLVTKPISATRCVGILRHGRLRVNDKVDTLLGQKTVKSIKINGENIKRAYPGLELEIEVEPPSRVPDPSLKKFGLIGLGIKPVKEIFAKVLIRRWFYHKGMRNGLITMIHFFGGKAKCKIEVEKMLESSQRQYDLRERANPPEKYYWSNYKFLRKTLDPGVLGLVKITPCDQQLIYVMTLSESSDLSRFYVTENSRFIGLGLVLNAAFNC